MEHTEYDTHDSMADPRSRLPIVWIVEPIRFVPCDQTIPQRILCRPLRRRRCSRPGAAKSNLAARFQRAFGPQSMCKLSVLTWRFGPLDSPQSRGLDPLTLLLYYVR